MPKTTKATTKKPPEKRLGATRSKEVEVVLKDLRDKDHPTLARAGFRVVFTGRKMKRFGTVQLMSEEIQKGLESNVHFLFILSKAHWDRYSDELRGRYLDELLCRCSYDELVARLERPDFAGYRKNILRYGLMGEEFEDAFRGMQLILPGMEKKGSSSKPAAKATATSRPTKRAAAGAVAG